MAKLLVAGEARLALEVLFGMLQVYQKPLETRKLSHFIFSPHIKRISSASEFELGPTAWDPLAVPTKQLMKGLNFSFKFVVYIFKPSIG